MSVAFCNYACENLLADYAEVVVKHRDCAIGVDGEVFGLVHEIVIPRSLTDNSEVVDQSIVELTVLE
jgi:hypothetical protein